MNPRPQPRPAKAPAQAHAHSRHLNRRHRSIDDRWNEEMTRVLREAAEGREERDRTRLSEDERSTRRESAALLDLIRTQDRPTAREHVSGGASARSSTSPKVTP